MSRKVRIYLYKIFIIIKIIIKLAIIYIYFMKYMN